LPFNNPDSVIAPVPPLATPSVPASVIAPVVVVLGVSPDKLVSNPSQVFVPTLAHWHKSAQQSA
jgi:hypothetical protein